GADHFVAHVRPPAIGGARDEPAQSAMFGLNCAVRTANCALNPDPHRRQRLAEIQLPRRSNVVFRVLDREIDVFREADAHAVVDLRPRPPQTRRDEVLRALRAKTLDQLAPSHRRLNRLNDRLPRERGTVREVESISRFHFMSLTLQTGNMLLRELGDESQIAPLTVEASARLFFLAIGDRKTDVESRRSFQKLEIAAVKRSGQLLAIAHRSAVVKEHDVVSE